jgi:hypothetical protein
LSFRHGNPAATIEGRAYEFDPLSETCRIEPPKARFSSWDEASVAENAKARRLGAHGRTHYVEITFRKSMS